MTEEDAMRDHGPILRNRANNFGRPCCDLLREAAELIELLQHRIQHGRWPSERPIEEHDDPSA